MKGKTVFNDDIFRIYIPFRKYLALEDILKKQNIQYSIDFEMPNSVTDVVRFYFDKKDKELVNDILIENGIVINDKKELKNNIQSTYYLSECGVSLLPIMETMILWSNKHIKCDC